MSEMKRLALRLVQWALGTMQFKKKFYSFFYFMYLQGLKGMDHGHNYIYPENSGELKVLKKIAHHYRDEKIVFFDAGANTGYYSESVLKIFMNSITLYCFEPSLFTFQKLTSKLGDSVKAFQVALSNQIGFATLHLDHAGSGVASLEDTAYAPPFGIVATMNEPVKTDTIDHFCYEHAIPRIHFLKMDVEGHEYAILEGAAEKLRQNSIDFIQFEFGRVNIDSGVPLKKFYKLLHQDYFIYRIIQTGLVPQFEYNYEYEIYLGTNFLAVSKLLKEDVLADDFFRP
jgi:FkbM family methyltransferase